MRMCDGNRGNKNGARTRRTRRADKDAHLSAASNKSRHGRQGWKRAAIGKARKWWCAKGTGRTSKNELPKSAGGWKASVTAWMKHGERGNAREGARHGGRIYGSGGKQVTRRGWETCRPREWTRRCFSPRGTWTAQLRFPRRHGSLNASYAMSSCILPRDLTW